MQADGNGKHVIERALELARGGGFRSVEEIRRALSRENYTGVDAHLAGLGIRRQLRAAIRQAGG